MVDRSHGSVQVHFYNEGTQNTTHSEPGTWQVAGGQRSRAREPSKGLGRAGGFTESCARCSTDCEAKKLRVSSSLRCSSSCSLRAEPCEEWGRLRCFARVPQQLAIALTTTHSASFQSQNSQLTRCQGAALLHLRLWLRHGSLLVIVSAVRRWPSLPWAEVAMMLLRTVRLECQRPAFARPHREQ